jgi:hypothetical protein
MYWSMGKSIQAMSTMFSRNGTVSSTRFGRRNPHQGMSPPSGYLETHADPCQFYLPPLPQRSLPSASTSLQASSSRRPYNEAQRERDKVEMDELDLQVERRKEIYRNELFVKVSQESSLVFSTSPLPVLLACATTHRGPLHHSETLPSFMPVR